MKMRRAGGYAQPGMQNSYDMVEEENERMMGTLSSKVKELKSLSIDIGQEVRYQNNMLNDMDQEFSTVDSFLQGTMGRLKALTKKGHHKLLCYVLLFCFCVMMVAWFIVRFR
ncbi:BET1 homolog [Hydractinia symbiolongicarpus]|uniref:BET1 homolog n=1 Tax=Hydractinia symbiolongicarpus TaxID=13093 RepID=UPI00254AB968|nr:BET1 homolog [Hydractinia symbiolongicarpus]